MLKEAILIQLYRHEILTTGCQPLLSVLAAVLCLSLVGT